MGVTVDRPSRQVRAQAANAAATSCSVPMRCTSCSRVSPWTSVHEEPRDSRPRRLAIPVEASAASWYQAALSTWSASSRSASRSGVARWPPGCSAAAWKVRAASTSSDARCWRGPVVCMPPIVVAGSVSAHGAQCPKGTRVAPIPNERAMVVSRTAVGKVGRQRVPRLGRQLGWLRRAGGPTSQVQTAGGSLAGNEHSLIASILSARSGPAGSLCWAGTAERAAEADPRERGTAGSSVGMSSSSRMRRLQDIRREVAAVSSAAETVAQPAAPRSP